MTGLRVAAWAALVHIVALARLWRTWWVVACAVTLYGAMTDRAMVQDAGTLLLAVLIVVLAWRGPTWWRAAGE